MRRSPFYAYPNFAHSFYAPPPEEAAYYHRPREDYHRPRRPFPPSSAPAPSPTSRSVINIPVFDCAPSCPSSLSPQKHPITPRPSPAVPLIDPPSAATKIQSHFRGFSVRRHRPLFHLRSIAKAREQLEELQSELQSPGFPLKVRASEKERLRFSESVMAIILSLDAIEGSMAEVRSQRKEATKMAIKLQDAIDAIILQKDQIADLQPTHGSFSDGAMTPEEDSVLSDQSDVNKVQGRVCTVSEESIMDVNPMQEESASPEDDVADKCMANVDNEDMVDDIVASLLDVVQQVEVGMSKSCFLESVPQDKLAGVMHDAEEDMTPVIGENAGDDATDGAEEAVNNGIDALHFVAPNSPMRSSALVAKVGQDSFVDDMKAANHGYAQEGSCDRSYACMEVKEDFSQYVELSPGTPTAEEKCDHPHHSNAAHQSHLQGPSTPLEKLTEGNCSSDAEGSPTLHRQEYENCSEVAYENPSGVGNSCDEANTQSSTLSMVETSLPPDNALLLQLSEDCRQLRSLVGKLLAQNKAQSNVLCALGERLELLERQQQLNSQQQMREKRKLRKGSKRSVKCPR